MSKTQEYRIKHALRLHAALMTKYENMGWSRDTASRKAYDEMKGRA